MKVLKCIQNDKVFNFNDVIIIAHCAFFIDSTQLVAILTLDWILLSDFINLTQVHNFTVSAQDIFTFRRLSVFTVSFTGILQLLMQIMKLFVPSY